MEKGGKEESKQAGLNDEMEMAILYNNMVFFSLQENIVAQEEIFDLQLD